MISCICLPNFDLFRGHPQKPIFDLFLGGRGAFRGFDSFPTSWRKSFLFPSCSPPLPFCENFDGESIDFQVSSPGRELKWDFVNAEAFLLLHPFSRLRHFLGWGIWVSGNSTSTTRLSHASLPRRAEPMSLRACLSMRQGFWSRTQDVHPAT